MPSSRQHMAALSRSTLNGGGEADKLAAAKPLSESERAALRETAMAAVREWIDSELAAGVSPMAISAQIMQAFNP
jgi:hypothetical protein